MQKIVPCLWFDEEAEEAVKFYLSVFKDSKIVRTSHYGDAGPRPKGMVMTIDFELQGQQFVALNGGPDFKFSEATSLIVNCTNQAEIDAMWDGLSEGGTKGVCGWVKDKYGFSWQVVPTVLSEMLQDPDAGRRDRVMAALLEMAKIDIDGLKRAYEGATAGRKAS